jgi:phosphoribosylglycinamide formyltransferase-1
MSRKRVAVLISGRGSNMVSLIEAARAADYSAEIVLVIANKSSAGGLELAKAAGIATAVIEHRAYPTREAFDAAMQAELERARIDIVCLAGFLRLLTPGFVNQWHGGMLNIHPALLPSFKGLDTHARALAAGVKVHGCTVHFVVPEMDAGPIIAQAAVPVADDDTEATLGARVLAQEHVIYPLALMRVASGQARLTGERVLTGAPLPSSALVVA